MEQTKEVSNSEENTFSCCSSFLSDDSLSSNRPSLPEISTPTILDCCADQSYQMNPLASSFIPILQDLDLNSMVSPNGSVSSDSEDDENPYVVLKNLKKKNFERPVIAHMDINSISSKFEPLTSMIKDNIDFLLITESKIDDTFPRGHFQIEGYARPIRLDRTRNGGGLIIFVRDDLTCKELRPRVLYPELECTFLELRVRQSKWLVVVATIHKKKK